MFFYHYSPEQRRPRPRSQLRVASNIPENNPADTSFLPPVGPGVFAVPLFFMSSPGHLHNLVESPRNYIRIKLLDCASVSPIRGLCNYDEDCYSRKIFNGISAGLRKVPLWQPFRGLSASRQHGKAAGIFIESTTS